MSYSVLLSPRATRDLRRLPTHVSSRVTAALMALDEDPRPSGSRKLTGTDDWRIRVGDYRICYRIDDPSRQVSITRIAHRRDVYRPMSPSSEPLAPGGDP